MDDFDMLIISVLQNADPMTPTEITAALNDAGHKVKYHTTQRAVRSLARFKILKEEPFKRILGGKMHYGYVYSVIGVE